jgi:threonine dehydratase
MSLPVQLGDVEAAAERIRTHILRTPLLRNDELDRRCGARVLIKPECLQLTGSFKIRGAVNRIAQLSRSELQRGVVAFSSGNHAQGIARAARIFGCRATIVMPQDAPAIKIDGVRRDGAEIVFYDRDAQSREDIAAALCHESGATLVPSFDDKHIVAGQGTVGLEIARQATEMAKTVDHMIVCTGGGGLVSGSALGLKSRFDSAQVWTAEPRHFDDWARSLDAGSILSNPRGGHSICDAILTPQPGRIPFEIARAHVAGGLVVSDDEVRAAMRFAFENLKLVVEPGGAVALAAALRGLPSHMQGTGVAIVISGGNVDPAAFAAIISA